MLESARKAGLDGVVLTERDYVRQKAVELLEKCTF